MKRKQFGAVIVAIVGVALFGASRPSEAETSSFRSELGASRTDVGAPASPAANAVANPEKVAVPVALSAVASGRELFERPVVKATPTQEPLLSSGACAEGMVRVEGDYCPWVEQKCLRWLDPETKMRCAEFEPNSSCAGKTVHKAFCIDRFEYPNKVGEKPVVMKTWYEAKSTCESEGKRLCGESEWTLACEGQERLPYPYGYARDADACNIDKPHPDPNEQLIANPLTRDKEVARLDQRDPSGARESCVSPYGVHDMTGNVDEWVVNESGRPFKSGLKGGYWGPVRTRCRPMTIAHNEDFMFYQIGFRCCGDSETKGVRGSVGTPADLLPAPASGSEGPSPLAGS